MPRGLRRSDRRIRPAENTDIIPPITDPIKDDEAVTGEIPAPVDAEVTGEIPPVADDDLPDDDIDDAATDLELPPGNDRGAELRAHAGRIGKYVWARLVLLAGALAAWLFRQTRIRVPQAGRWLRPRLTRLTATIVAGLLLCASYPRFNWWWAAILAFAVLAWVLTRPATTPFGGFGYGALFGVAFYLPLIRWISILVGGIPLLALVALCAAFPGLFGLAAVTARRLPGWPIWFALLWTAQEWLKCTIPFGGFPWGVVAAGQTSGPFLPLARLGGVPLLSLAIVLTGCAAAALVMETVTWWWAARRRHGSDQHSAADARIADAPPAVVLPALCICLMFFLAAAVWPQVRHSGTGAGNEPTVTAAIVQGNVPRLGLEFNAQRLAVLGNDVRETRHLADDVRAGRAPQPDFVVWPEDASEIDPTANPEAAQEISVAVEAIGAPILVGTVLDLPNRSIEDPAQTNTVIVWNPKTGPGDRHDKRIVQPFGEYLPWRGFFRHLSSMADMAGYIVPGKGTGVVRAGNTPIGIATCWEVSFDRALQHSVRNGAQVLAVPANNANFNQTMSEQQLAFSKLRAVELDRYALVSSNVGISAIVTPDGRELHRTRFFTPGYLDNQVRLKTTMTPAAKWGPIVQGALVVAALAVLFAAILHNGWFADIHRRLSELANRGAPAPDNPDDDPVGDDAVVDDGDELHPSRQGPAEGDL
ncbi:apolipoprotein N-acyltransferase [Candidatus Mycobacterium wuenschmannii]|uniref:Apolipoprotein N-acyltransferase n=1 Tax=Candidatus Mycobacterium wuenschmannii TaxID=3027808 RepID=A0ABY8W1X6_9MYCO|nr:apolipoprotein N-acyltransferase [Candidatus Mycobacterium wuenschmannii]WIM89121.1 apolipoprotein N-acyltransferase [Candidatus Mycobacterium wuenschmannii]